MTMTMAQRQVVQQTFFDPSLKHLACLATRKSCDTTKQSVCGWNIHIYLCMNINFRQLDESLILFALIINSKTWVHSLENSYMLIMLYIYLYIYTTFNRKDSKALVGILNMALGQHPPYTTPLQSKNSHNTLSNIRTYHAVRKRTL